MEQVSFVRAVKNFFEEGRYGRKVEISEFKALSADDKVELRNLLIEQGQDVAEIGAAVQ